MEKGMRADRCVSLMLVAFPVLLALGILLIPVVADYSDHSLAVRAVGQTWRWFLGHILAALAFGYSVWVIATLDEHMRSTGHRLHRLTISSLVFGASLYAAGLGADGVGPVALLTAGQDPTGFFDGSGLWVTSLFVAGTVLYGLGLISMVVTLNNAGQLLGAARWIAFLGALLFACAPAILSGWALYGVAAAAFMVFIPVARMVARQA
jgi:ABC-type spermidine/putrescine transport system permease subunit II